MRQIIHSASSILQPHRQDTIAPQRESTSLCNHLNRQQKLTELN